MRRHLSSALACILVALVATSALQAQPAGLATEGAPFLLLPVGARAVGMGQAVVAEQHGSEGVWWNPAGLARAEKLEVAVHHYETVVGVGDAISLLVPSSLLGVLTASAYFLNYGKFPATDPDGNPTGDLSVRNVAYAATYATPVGSRINAGITFKVVQLRLDCSGACPSFSASTSALDFGAQYDLTALAPVSVGVAVRNLGVRLQVNDSPQADPLPTRIQIGVMYRVQGIERYARETELRLTGDVVDKLELSSPAPRLGADLTWRKRAHLRGGYVFDAFESSEMTGPSLGLGLTAGDLHVDLATIFEGFSSDAGKTPTYLSLRYLF